MKFRMPHNLMIAHFHVLSHATGGRLRWKPPNRDLTRLIPNWLALRHVLCGVILHAASGLGPTAEGSLELVPDAVLILCVGAAVVYDDVANGADARRLQLGDQRNQLLLVAVAAVQVVELPWKIPLRVMPSKVSRGGYLQVLE